MLKFFLLKKLRRARPKFKDVILDVKGEGRRKTRIDRQTLIIVENVERRKKNLAYYDKEIYNILKSRKNVEVIFCGERKNFGMIKFPQDF